MFLDNTSKDVLSQVCAQFDTSEAIQPDDTPSVTEAAIDLKDLDTSVVTTNAHKPSNTGISNLISSHSAVKSPLASAPPSLLACPTSLQNLLHLIFQQHPRQLWKPGSLAAQQ